MLRKGLLLLLVLGAGQLAGCGSEQSPVVQGGTTSTPTTAVEITTTTSTTVAVRTYAEEAITADARYRITLAVGEKTATPAADECPPTSPPGPGRSSLRVSLTVANPSTDRAAPFPPLRVELTTDGGRDKVLLRDPTGTCSFTPRVAQIGPGQSAVFKGTTPAIADTAAPGTAGRIEVSISENRFTLVAPVP